MAIRNSFLQLFQKTVIINSKVDEDKWHTWKTHLIWILSCVSSSRQIAMARKSVDKKDLEPQTCFFIASFKKSNLLCQSLWPGWPPRNHCFHASPITLWSLQLKKWKYLVPKISKLKLLQVKITRVDIWVPPGLPPRTSHISFKVPTLFLFRHTIWWCYISNNSYQSPNPSSKLKTPTKYLCIFCKSKTR